MGFMGHFEPNMRQNMGFMGGQILWGGGGGGRRGSDYAADHAHGYIRRKIFHCDEM